LKNEKLKIQDIERFSPVTNKSPICNRCKSISYKPSKNTVVTL